MASFDTRTVHLRAIHALGRELGLDHAALNCCVQDGQFGISLGEMSVPELADFAKWLRKKAALLGNKSAISRNKPKWDKQDKKIFKLGFLLEWQTRDLRKYFMRIVNKDEIRDLSAKEKAFVIVGMEKVLEHKRNAKSRKLH